MRLLLKRPLDERATTIVGMVQTSVQRMGGLIDNVMDFARGRLGGSFWLERKTGVDLERILRGVIAELQINQQNRVIDADFQIAAKIECDPRRMGQLVSNLLGNAISYGSPDQPIRFFAKTESGELELYIANAGEPIPPAVMNDIFKPFTRGAARPMLQGLGLGLYIAHEIATAHGGRLTVTSTAEETRFTLRMPCVA
jgi:signal transduction histidine kinase